MSINLRHSANASGTRNVFDNVLDFSSFGGSPGASGTTNVSAVSSFNAAYAALPAGRTRLYIPPGSYNFNAQFSLANTTPAAGSKLQIDAYGVTIVAPGGTSSSVANNAGIGTDGTKEARIVTVSAGTSTVTLVTAGQTSRFSVGGWCMVSAVDVQGFGDPPNPGIFEFKKIQSIGTGTLTFTEPLKNSYKDTYPVYSTGRGGPATVYPIQGAWDQEVEFKGARFSDTGNLTYCKTRVAKWTDCTFDSYGPCPTVNNTCEIQRCTTLSTELEVDKLVDNLLIRDCNFNAIVFQSLCVNNLYAENVTINPGQYWRGSANNSVIRNLSTPTYWFGLFAYGTLIGNTTLINCSATTASYNTSYRTLYTTYTEGGTGALTIASASGATPWAVPGAWCVLTDAGGTYNGISFQITDVSTSGGNTVISTTLSQPVPGTAGGRTAPWYIVPHPGKDTTLIGCTGNSVFTTASANPPNSPIFGWS